MTSIPTATALTTDDPIIPLVQLIKDDGRRCPLGRRRIKHAWRMKWVIGGYSRRFEVTDNYEVDSNNEKGINCKQWFNSDYSDAYRRLERQRHDRPLLCLLDSWSTYSWIKKAVLPSGVNGKTVDSFSNQTLAGVLKSNQAIEEVAIQFPEFHRLRTIYQRI